MRKLRTYLAVRDEFAQHALLVRKVDDLERPGHLRVGRVLEVVDVLRHDFSGEEIKGKNH